MTGIIPVILTRIQRSRCDHFYILSRETEAQGG